MNNNTETVYVSAYMDHCHIMLYNSDNQNCRHTSAIQDSKAIVFMDTRNTLLNDIL